MRNTLSLLLVMFVGALSVITAQNSLEVGDKVANFTTVDADGKTWQLQDHLETGELLVIYFYPAAMTGGCTKQACSFRDNHSVLDSLNVKIVGVSGDNAEGLAVFKAVYSLNFNLISDIDGKIATLFSVPFRKGGSLVKTVDGKSVTLTRGVTSNRWTFVLDESGTVVFKNSSVDVNKESEELIKWVQSRR